MLAITLNLFKFRDFKDFMGNTTAVTTHASSLDEGKEEDGDYVYDYFTFNMDEFVYADY